MLPRDLFMQFKYIDVTTGADASAIVEGEASTGLSIRGAYGWLIHELQLDVPKPPDGQDFYLNVVLSVVQGETDMPELDDKGVIEKFTSYGLFTTSGYQVKEWCPRKVVWQPPIIIASPHLSLYVQGTNDAAFNSKKFRARLGYTTHPLSSPEYLEVAETWETL